MPSVVPRTKPTARRGHSPCRMAGVLPADVADQARCSMKACSATASWFVPGAKQTATPWSVAACKSMAS